MWQAKRGTTTRGEMEDRGGGWKRIKTSDHYDISYKIVDEFWHSDLASDPDNQNKAQVPVFVGFDELTRRRRSSTGRCARAACSVRARRACCSTLRAASGRRRWGGYAP